RKLRLQSIKRRRYPFLRGVANPKIPLLKKYRFNLCLENVKDVPGYITEKIFDCFFAGCVPVYLGANNVLEYIPKRCFIDLRDFQDMESVYDFMTRMDDETYRGYLKNIREFLGSPQAEQFTASHFAKVVSDSVLLQAKYEAVNCSAC